MAATPSNAPNHHSPNRVGSSVRYPNRRRAVEKLVLAMEQGVSEGLGDDGKVASPRIGVSAEPRRWTQTPLTAKEVDAIRTAYAAEPAPQLWPCTAGCTAPQSGQRLGSPPSGQSPVEQDRHRPRLVKAMLPGKAFWHLTHLTPRNSILG